MKTKLLKNIIYVFYALCDDTTVEYKPIKC